MKKVILMNRNSLIGLALFLVTLGNTVSGQTSGKIVLEKQTPTTAVVVTATQQVVLKPGFHAIGDATSSFDAKIGAYNSLSPVIQVASGSTVVIPTSPSTGQNYILTKTYLVSTDDSPTLNTIQYFDGLGRPTQTVVVGITQSGADLVSRVNYDNEGRENIKYLPVPIGGNFGLFADDGSLSSGAGTVYGSDSRPYIETLLEASPLNRPTGQKKPGDDWSGHAATISYETNGSDVLYFTVSSTNTLQKGINYTANTLYKTVNTDEDLKSVTEYKDKLGHVVMKQSSTDVQTYYVYNDLNQLSYVLPPGFVDGIGSSTYFDDTNVLLKQFGYVYRYDERGNCIYKRLPGCTPIYMVYDKADRMVLSQDGNQRKRLQGTSIQWSVTKYDVLGRAVFTGLMYRSETDSLLNYKSIRDVLSNDVVTDSYAGFTNATPLTISYYDNYNFLSSSPSTLAYQVLTGYDNAYPVTATSASGLNATGLLTGTRTYFLDGSGSNTIAMYYDDHAHVVQTRATNHLGGFDLAYNQYDFIGKVVKTYKTHGINGASDTYKELYTYTYDNGQRLKTTTYSLNGATPVPLVSNKYDELGRLQTKTIGNNVDATNYNYNIHGSITDLNGSKFSENLYYNLNTVNLPNFTPCYNGNIAGMKWNVANENLGYQRAYSFDYDDLNRLTNSVYSGNNNSATVSGTLDKYTEKLDYKDDKMGNLKALTRYENRTLVENLSLSYQGNQLQKVDNSISHFVPYGSELFRDYDNHIVIPKEYAFDVNGNMLYDANGGVSDIEYNVLNLPDKIHFTAGHKNLYTYDAGGQKLKVVNYSSNRILDIPMGTITPLSSTPSDYTVLTTDYVGNMIYQNGALKEILLPEGYYQNGTFYYYLKDHLGDNRVTINSSGTVVEKSHYYPSGTRFFTESSSNSTAIPYRYNGKELEAMNGINQMDYGARRRFAGLPVWTGVDPMCEKRYSISPYAYCSNNPVNLIDPDGMDESPVYDNNANFLGTDDEGLKGIPIIMEKENFTQGMEHKKAMQYDQGENVLKENGSFDKFINHYNGLVSRPDFDGFITATEGINWAKSHPNALKNPSPENTLYINTALLDFGNIATSDFINGVGKISPIQLLSSTNIIDSQFNEDLYNTVYALGRINMILLNKNNRTVRIVNDEASDYDWNRGGGFLRSILIDNERHKQGLNDSHGFKVYYYGVGRLNLTLKDM